MRFTMAIAVFLLALPPLCGAMLFWSMVVWNTAIQGLGTIGAIEWRLWAGGATATVAALLLILLGCSLVYPKDEPPA